MDFILEMYADDNPDDMKFVRPGQPLPEHELQAEFERRLLGNARADFLKNFMPSAAVLKKSQEIQQGYGSLLRAAKG